jgi:hypothetical protein
VSLRCNAIQLDAETYPEGVPATFDLANGGSENAASCSCGASSAKCQVLSSGLAPPTPIASF